MRVKVQVIIESDTGQRLVEEVASLVRNTLSAETLGLSLAEAKKILQSLQARVVNQQISKHLQEQRHCGLRREFKLGFHRFEPDHRLHPVGKAPPDSRQHLI